MISQEIYNLKTILESFLGESKKDIDDSYQLQFACPRCVENKGDKEKHKYNLEINLKKGVYNCWSCGQYDDDMHGSILKLIKLYGNNSILNEYKLNLRNLQTSKLYKINFKDGDFNIDFTIAENKNVQLPSLYTPFMNNNTINKKALNYLFSRGIGWDIIKKYHIGYTNFSKENKQLSSRIIIPSFNKYGELNYWVSRDYTNLPRKDKYYNPIVEKKNIIFNEEKVEWDADVTLVEGPFDHIVVPNSIPLLGKVLRYDFKLYQQIVTNANANINIFLDADAINDVKKIYQLLNHDKLYGRIRYIPVPNNEDPSSIYQKYGKKGILKCLSNGTKINEAFLTL